jgi:hypothetical protein
MIFRKKTPSAVPSASQPVLRGRDSVESGSNPLARRFHPDDEPDTIDLQQPAEFTAEPDTGNMEPAETVTPDHLGVITLTPATGKFYVQPGQGGLETYLGDDLVLAPTELRRGDHVRIGDFELQLFRKGEKGA